MAPTDQSNGLRSALLAGFVVAGILVAACGGDEDATPPAVTAPDGRAIARFEGLETYPFDTPEDIRTFTDAWVAVEVTAERLGPIEGDGDREGYQPRWVTVTVTDTLWQRPDVVVPKILETQGALLIREYGASHAVARGAVPLVVGGEFVVGLIRGPDGKLDVANPRAILPRRGATDATSGASADEVSPVGVTADEFVAEVATAAPVVADSVVDPDDRLRAWHAVRDGSTTTSAPSP